jgi:hypothetical protein
MQPDAEHQQDDADLRQFQRKVLVGHEARRVRPDENAGDEISDERGNAETVGDGAEDEGQAEAGDDGGDQRRIMRHRSGCAFATGQRCGLRGQGPHPHIVDGDCLVQPRHGLKARNSGANR